MPRTALAELDRRRFDVTVVGAGVNGASAAQHLAASGYRVLIVDKGDFGSGASSRSGRIQHCGLRFLEPGEGLGYRRASTWDALLKPRQTLRNLRRARDAMHARAQMAATMPERLQGFTFCYPVWRGDRFSPWQVGLALRTLTALGPSRGTPLEARRLAPEQALKLPLLRRLRDPDRLAAVYTWREYHFEWAERIVLDTVLDAERLGAVARNYTEAVGMTHREGRWRISLADAGCVAVNAKARVNVESTALINAAGAWTDAVNRLGDRPVKDRVRGTKGSHIVVRLPPECAELGICTHTREHNPMTINPWRGLHFIGPTDTPYTGDLDDVRASEDEIEHLLSETNALLPGADLRREDVCFTWAGVRPLTHDPETNGSVRGYRLHALAEEGMPNAFALTSGPILSHRIAGRKLRDAVARSVAPTGTPGEISYRAKCFPAAEPSPHLLNTWDGARIADLRHAAEHEQPVNLVDLLFRRVGAGWTESMAREGARTAAEAVADILDWSPRQVDAQVEQYLNHINERHHCRH